MFPLFEKLKVSPLLKTKGSSVFYLVCFITKKILIALVYCSSSILLQSKKSEPQNLPLKWFPLFCLCVSFLSLSLLLVDVLWLSLLVYFSGFSQGIRWEVGLHLVWTSSLDFIWRVANGLGSWQNHLVSTCIITFPVRPRHSSYTSCSDKYPQMNQFLMLLDEECVISHRSVHCLPFSRITVLFIIEDCWCTNGFSTGC